MCLVQGHSTMTEVSRLGIEPGTLGFENMAWRILIEGHPRNISTKLFENLLTSLGEEDFFFVYFVAMETRILHGSQNLKEIW